MTGSLAPELLALGGIGIVVAFAGLKLLATARRARDARTRATLPSRPNV